MPKRNTIIIWVLMVGILSLLATSMVFHAPVSDEVGSISLQDIVSVHKDGTYEYLIASSGITLVTQELVNKQDPRDFKGKTLDLYYYLLKNPGFHGVRELQRTFEYSSPNLAQYHLNKLYYAGIIEKSTEGKYGMIDNDVKLGDVQQQYRIANRWIEKSSIYAIVSAILGIIGLLYWYLDMEKTYWIATYIPAFFVFTLVFSFDKKKMHLN